jgi:hypothetical protein
MSYDREESHVAVESVELLRTPPRGGKHLDWDSLFLSKQLDGPTGKATMTRRILINTMVAGAAVVAVPAIAQAAPDSTAKLLDLEEQIFAAHEAATVHDTEIERLNNIFMLKRSGFIMTSTAI